MKINATEHQTVTLSAGDNTVTLANLAYSINLYNAGSNPMYLRLDGNAAANTDFPLANGSSLELERMIKGFHVFGSNNDKLVVMAHHA